METPKYHEILPAVKEVVASIGERALNWIIPREALDMFVHNESANRTAPLHTQEELIGE